MLRFSLLSRLEIPSQNDKKMKARTSLRSQMPHLPQKTAELLLVSAQKFFHKTTKKTNPTLW
jgi:hypothetical protein